MKLKTTIAILVLGTNLLTIGIYRTILANTAKPECTNITQNTPTLPTMPTGENEGGEDD